ncbi:sclerostin domain-containing protein 1a [Eucyclogobius newberryi]|uniref:sclerostin domain-containing protein 1a n=1 Tax=Eucyclogobius newberryi TaxID=166745 RepID=UPI003B59B0D9
MHGRGSLLFLCLLLRSCCLALAFRNDATELLSSPGSRSSRSSRSSSVPSPERQGNGSLLLPNRARTGGRGTAGGGTHDRNDKVQIGCRELRSTKYISDGHCTSIKPIKELVCTGECLPAQLLPNWIGRAHGSRLWGKKSSIVQDWRCVNDKTRTQRIQLQCQDGSSRTYKITVVTSCKCKRYSRQHNQSGGKFEEEEEEDVMSSLHLLPKHQAKRRQGKKKYMDNWHEP